MRKFIHAFLILVIIIGVLNLCDLYSGYKLSLGVDRVFTTEENTIEATHKQEAKNEENLNNYLYRHMDEHDKKTYNTIYNAVLGFKTPVFIGYFEDVQDAFDIFKIVMSEHPELFWCTGQCSFGAGGFLNIDYAYSKSEAMEKKKLIEEKTDEFIAGLDGDEYTKALACYEYVILNTCYDMENLDRILEVPADSSIEGVFLKNTAVCAGYAKAYQYLLQKAGLTAMYVVGVGSNSSGSENHAWIIQQIDGKYYYSDPTWDDTKNDKLVCHSYFCITAGEITVNHEIDELYPLLTANSLEANYFVRENRYFDEYSVSDVRKVIADSLEQNQDFVEFRYKTQDEYEKAKECLFQEGEIYIAFKPMDFLKYSVNTEKITLIKDDVHRVIMLIYNKDNN